jgi:hypothetical protein
VYKLS